jgi:hypothetical protein
LHRWATERYGITLEVVYPPARLLQRYAPELLEEVGSARVLIPSKALE